MKHGDGECQKCGAREFEMCRDKSCYNTQRGEHVARLLLIALLLTFIAMCLVLWSMPHEIS